MYNESREMLTHIRPKRCKVTDSIYKRWDVGSVNVLQTSRANKLPLILHCFNDGGCISKLLRERSESIKFII